MILLLEMIIDDNLNKHEFANKLYKWHKSGFPELGDIKGNGIGGSTLSVITHPIFLKHPIKASREFWEGSGKTMSANGSLMRCAFRQSL